MNELLGRRLKDRRELLGLSQSVLASQVGLSRASISNLEAGKQGMSLDTLYKIAPVLHVEPRDLLPALGEMSNLVRSNFEVGALITKHCKNSTEADWLTTMLTGTAAPR